MKELLEGTNSDKVNQMSRLKTFREDIAVADPSFEQIVQKHILAARCETLDEIQERDLRIVVSEVFKVPITSVCVVGSAKLGFRMFKKPANSLKQLPERLQFSPFDDYSDIDVAIISQANFLTHWRKVYDYFRDGGYESRSNWTGSDENHNFGFYLMQGWIRPDAMPGTGIYDQKSAWQTKVNEINAKKIAQVAIKVGLYFDEKFLVGYHANAIRKCKERYGG